MLISRREFIKLVGAALASGAVVPAFATARPPYVSAGEVVDYIGRSPGGFIGGRLVYNVGLWDGIGYQVKVYNNSYGKYRAIDTFYDFDLANLIKDVPRGFWSIPGSKKYPNVHTWVREQRFGETIEEAMRHLNFTGVEMPPQQKKYGLRLLRRI